jgi:hypothetical protein
MYLTHLFTPEAECVWMACTFTPLCEKNEMRKEWIAAYCPGGFFNEPRGELKVSGTCDAFHS